MAEWLGNQASNQKVAGSIPAVRNDVVSLGTLLALVECPCTYCKLLWIRVSPK